MHKGDDFPLKSFGSSVWDRLLKHSTVGGDLALPMPHCCPVPSPVNMRTACHTLFFRAPPTKEFNRVIVHSTVPDKQSSTALPEQTGNNYWSHLYKCFWGHIILLVTPGKCMCAHDVQVHREDLTYSIHTAQSYIWVRSGHSNLRRDAVCFKDYFSASLLLTLRLDWAFSNYLNSLQIVKPVIIISFSLFFFFTMLML